MGEVESGTFNVLLEVKQAEEITAYLDLKIIVNPEIIVDPAFIISMDDNIEEETEEEPEPEPEPEEPEEEVVKEEVQEEELDEDTPPDADGSISMAPWIPPWKNLASKEDVDKFFGSMEKPTIVVEKEIPPVKVSLGTISRDGKIELAFN